MTDSELADIGERFYRVLVAPPATPIEVSGLMAAIRTRTPWSMLGPTLKTAFFRIVNAAMAGRALPGAAPAAPAPSAAATDAPVAAPTTPETTAASDEPDDV